MSRRYESVFPVSHDGPLELARVLLRPALYHDLLLRVELNRVVSLSVQYSEETVFPSAKGEVCHGSRHADVDPDISGGRAVAKFAGCGSA